MTAPVPTLERPTLGAYRRAHGQTDELCLEARVALAWELVQEARRRWAMDQLEGVFVGLTHGADPTHIARRLRRLADQLDPPATPLELETAA